MAWYEQAFGLETKFLDESGFYGEMQTGEITLGFLAEAEAEGFHYPVRSHRSIPTGFSLSMVSEDVDRTYAQVLKRPGASSVHGPIDRPWGQRSAMIKDPNGILIEIYSPLQAFSSN